MNIHFFYQIWNVFSHSFYSFFFWLHYALCGNFPDQGLNLCPLKWKHRLLTPGPLGKFLQPSFLQMFFLSPLFSFLDSYDMGVDALDSVL